MNRFDSPKIPTLETPRLWLRPFSLDDAGDVQSLAGDRAIADTTLNIPHPYEDGCAEQWLSTHESVFENAKGVTFAIVLKESNNLIGAIGLTGALDGHRAEMGYWVARHMWNRGYCTEAALAVVDYGLTTLNLQRIHACHLSRNPASGRVMLKIGMTHEGTLRKHEMKWGVLEDLEIYGVLRADWLDPDGS